MLITGETEGGWEVGVNRNSLDIPLNFSETKTALKKSVSTVPGMQQVLNKW